MRAAAKCQAAKAAAAAGVPFTLSTVSACSLGEVAAAGHVPWFQLYFVKDRGFVGEHDRAGQGGGLRRVDADRRPRGARIALSRCARRLAEDSRRHPLQLLARPGWLWDVGIRGRPHSLGNLEPIVGRRAPLERLPGAGSTPISTRR